ncbi:MAG TPA: phospholipase D family protein [Steroidobacteraceae bacterium]|nr:phospholipase D family protein [Steroidobacteraceae bacterium]
MSAPLRRSARRFGLGIALVTWFAIGLWNVTKPMPPGTDVATEFTPSPVADVAFLADLSYRNGAHEPVREQEIFDEIFRIIAGARTFLVLDFFLLNDHAGEAGDQVFRPLSRELVDRLIAVRTARPELDILVITDPVNTVYGGEPLEQLDRLQASGIEVVMTDLTRLRDPNPAYSALWRTFVQWFGNSPEGGWLPNPFESGPSQITLRSWLALLNFKANHRKVVIADQADGDWVALVTSANPHDASSAHSNVALRFRGALAASVLASELEIAGFSGWRGRLETGPAPQVARGAPESFVQLKYTTEGEIRRSLVAAIERSGQGDTIQIATFYLSDRAVIDALLDASRRGVGIRVILDPNKDAFGRVKDGIPNRPVAAELVRESNGNIEVRWYRTHGEQFHTKLAIVTGPERIYASLGSANLTRRNIGNYNLEANVVVDAAADSTLAFEMTEYFDRIWNNNDRALGIVYTDPFERWEDPSQLRYWRYRLMEATGLSTF